MKIQRLNKILINVFLEFIFVLLADRDVNISIEHYPVTFDHRNPGQIDDKRTMNLHKPVGWKLFSNAFQADLRHHRIAVNQMDFDVFVLALDVFDVVEFDADEFIFRINEQMICCCPEAFLLAIRA